MRLWALAAFAVIVNGMGVGGATAHHAYCAGETIIESGPSPTGYKTSGILRVEVRVWVPANDCGLDAFMWINGEERALTIESLGSGHYKVWHEAEFSGRSYAVYVSWWNEHGQGRSYAWHFMVLPSGADPEGREIAPGAGAGARIPDQIGFDDTCVLFLACAGPFWTPSPVQANASASIAPVVVRYGYSPDSIGPFTVSEDPIPVSLCRPGCPFPSVGRTETEVHVDVTIMNTSIPVHQKISI